MFLDIKKRSLEVRVVELIRNTETKRTELSSFLDY